MVEALAVGRWGGSLPPLMPPLTPPPSHRGLVRGAAGASSEALLLGSVERPGGETRSFFKAGELRARERWRGAQGEIS